MTAIPLIDGTSGARLPVKPPFGSPCNGCGWCCASEPCGIAREFIGADSKGACPALEREGGRFVCGMIVRPSHYLGLGHGWSDEILAPMIADALGAGRGCDAEGP